MSKKNEHIQEHVPREFTGPQLAIATLALALSTFMQVLDTTIANVSVPAIAGNLAVSPNQGTWVITAFAASNAIMMPLTGWLAGRFGEVKLFIISTLLFSFTSLLCGLSPNFTTLVMGRILQGIAAAPMMPLSQSLLLRIYPEHKKGLALAFWSMTATIAPIAGPLLGGYITDEYSWPWIFYINLPIGILGAFVVYILLGKNDTPTHIKPIDTIGLALLVLGVGSLQIMLDKANELDWFSSTTIIALTAIAVVSITFFIIWELFNEHPVVDLTLFKKRNFLVGATTLSISYAVFLGGGVVFPLWLQTQMGYTAFWAGAASSLVGIFAFLFSPIVGANLHRFNLRVLVTIGFSIFAISYYLSSIYTPQSDLWHIALPRLVLGAGMAMYFIPLTTILIAGVEPHRIASAMGLTNFLRVLGGGIGTSLAISFWGNRTNFHHANLAELANPYNINISQAIDTLNNNGISGAAWLDNAITAQASLRASDDIFLISAYLFILLIGLIWFAKPPFMAKRESDDKVVTLIE
ncbi:MAG: DHA2 family efflux MFS transporter permease subunit [Sulfurovaceae bacterium]|nr:DHA2 family efflux MFS transporter permease subunit [Sulfurovaceae bacterium]